MRIKELRKKKNMTQQELADLIGVDFSIISRYENGTVLPPLYRLQRIADVLDVTVDYLMMDENTDRQHSYKIAPISLLDTQKHSPELIKDLAPHAASAAASYFESGYNASYVEEAPTPYGTDTSTPRRPKRNAFYESVDADCYFKFPDWTKTKKILDEAKGRCELCENEAPFTDKNGNPYLEIHFIQWLSKGGLPTPQNTVLLCPNCHRKVHLLNDKNDIKKLKAVALHHQF